jgi:hypothetical protein
MLVSGALTKPFKARYLDLFTKKKVKMKRIWQWFFQLEPYMEIQCLVMDLQ